MSRVTRLTVLSLLLVSAWAIAPASGDTAKEARGIVTSVRADAIMINLPSDIDVTFRVDGNTCVVARGAGTKMRKAKAEGASGVKLADLVPIGASVEVSYEERDGHRYARRIVSVASR